MSSSCDIILGHLGAAVASIPINAAAGAAAGSVGSSLLGIQHKNYDVLLATKSGAAGSATLSLALIGMFGFLSCTNACCKVFGGGSSDNLKSAYVALALVDLVFVAISGGAGYRLVDREGSSMSYDQSIAATATGEAAILTVIILAAVAYAKLGNLNFSCLSNLMPKRELPSVNNASAPPLPPVAYAIPASEKPLPQAMNKV